MAKESAECELSVVSIREMAIKRLRGALQFLPSDLEMAIVRLDLRILPFAKEHALNMFELGGPRGERFDNQLIAQALAEDTIVTCDEAFERYQGLRVIW